MEASFDAHRERRGLFGGDAAGYAVGRPGYPDRVYELLEQRSGLVPEARVVEVGPGTGQATRRLLDANATVTAVELSREMADHLRAALDDDRLTVIVGAFEDVDLEPGSVDLVVSATAFHWVPTADGLRRAADALRAGGHLALWWNVFGDPARPDPFHDALVPVLERVAPSVLDVPGSGSILAESVPYALDVAARIAEIRSEGRFVDIDHELIPWTGRHRADELRALFGSFSPWLALPASERTAALDALERLANDEFGGVVERPYLTALYLARRG